MNIPKQVKNKIVKVPFRAFNRVALAGGVGAFPIQPSGVGTLASIANAYALYRVTKLNYRLHPGVVLNGTQIAAYIPGVTDTQPSSLSDICQVLTATVLGYRQNKASDWTKLGLSQVSSYMPWLKTIAGSPDAAEETIGQIYVVGSSTDTYELEICGEFEFKDIVPTSSTPELRNALAQERLLQEKLRSLRLTPNAGRAGGSTAQAI